MGEGIMQRPLAQLSYAAIDFESAGAAPGETDCPVQVGIVRVDGLFSAEELYDSYIASEHPVHWSAAKVHGITTERLLHAPAFAALWPELRRLLSGCVVVGHNPSTEMRFLRAFPGHGFAPWLDTLALARQAMPGLEDYSLSRVSDALGVTPQVEHSVPGRRWHDALYDAMGSLAVLRAIIRGLQMEQSCLAAIPFAIKEKD